MEQRMDPLEDPNLLPSQAFTTAAALLDSVDMVSLRDGRKLFGVLRSFDQFANLVLQDTVERIYVGDTYGEQRHGVFIVRGENVALLGEIDVEKEERAEELQLPGSKTSLRQVPFEEVKKIQKDNLEKGKKRERVVMNTMRSHGFNAETYLDNLY